MHYTEHVYCTLLHAWLEQHALMLGNTMQQPVRDQKQQHTTWKQQALQIEQATYGTN